MTDNNSKFHVLSNNLSLYVKNTVARVSATAVVSLMDAWGLGIWGTPNILGGGYTNTHETGEGLNVLAMDISNNVQRLPVLVYSFVVSTGMLAWGAAQFGTDDILGTGSLITSEG